MVYKRNFFRIFNAKCSADVNDTLAICFNYFSQIILIGGPGGRAGGAYKGYKNSRIINANNSDFVISQSLEIAGSIKVTKIILTFLKCHPKLFSSSKEMFWAVKNKLFELKKFFPCPGRRLRVFYTLTEAGFEPRFTSLLMELGDLEGSKHF